MIVGSWPAYLGTPKKPKRAKEDKSFNISDKIYKQLNTDTENSMFNSSTVFCCFDEGEFIKLNQPLPIVKKSLSSQCDRHWTPRTKTGHFRKKVCPRRLHDMVHPCLSQKRILLQNNNDVRYQDIPENKGCLFLNNPERQNHLPIDSPVSETTHPKRMPYGNGYGGQEMC